MLSSPNNKMHSVLEYSVKLLLFNSNSQRSQGRPGAGSFRAKDVETIRKLLAEDVLLFEHSVKNDGLEDVFGHHLKPEIEAFEDLQLDFSDVRITKVDGMALVTRDYKVKGKLGERMIDAGGNETMVWRQINGNWKIIHIHYSHPCPRSP